MNTLILTHIAYYSIDRYEKTLNVLSGQEMLASARQSQLLALSRYEVYYVIDVSPSKGRYEPECVILGSYSLADNSIMRGTI